MPHFSRQLYFVIPGFLVLLLLIAYAGGFLGGGKIQPGRDAVANEHPRPLREVPAERQEIAEYNEAVGTVRPRAESQISSQVTARIVDIPVSPGQRVKPGDLLVALDQAEFIARLEQAEQSLRSARARRGQAAQTISAARAATVKAESTYRRLQALFMKHSVAEETLDGAESEYRQSQAGYERARGGLQEAESGIDRAEKVVEEARIALGYTRIEAREPAEVVRRLAEPGDTAFPGNGLLILQTSAGMRLEALVRESLISKTQPGALLDVEITAIGKTMQGRVEEVIPSADPLTRSFLVKVALPPAEGLYPGMFGRLRIPAGRVSIVTVPAEAVKKIGQLETVMVRNGQTWEVQYVKTGRTLGDRVEILSGLDGGEVIGIMGNANAA